MGDAERQFPHITGSGSLQTQHWPTKARSQTTLGPSAQRITVGSELLRNQSGVITCTLQGGVESCQRFDKRVDHR